MSILRSSSKITAKGITGDGSLLSCRASTLSPRAGGQSLAALSARQLTQLSCFHNAVKVILLRLSEPCCHAKLIGGYSSTSEAADAYFLIVGT